jgi:hypothetical protein
MKKWLKLLAPLLAMAAIESATAAPPLYQLIEPRPAKSAIPTWAPHFAAFDTVVGYSDLGHVFMHDSQTKRYAMLHPYQKGAKNYGEFKTVADFESRHPERKQFSVPGAAQAARGSHSPTQGAAGAGPGLHRQALPLPWRQ